MRVAKMHSHRTVCNRQHTTSMIPHVSTRMQLPIALAQPARLAGYSLGSEGPVPPPDMRLLLPDHMPHWLRLQPMRAFLHAHAHACKCAPLCEGKSSCALALCSTAFGRCVSVLSQVTSWACVGSFSEVSFNHTTDATQQMLHNRPNSFNTTTTVDRKPRQQVGPSD